MDLACVVQCLESFDSTLVAITFNNKEALATAGKPSWAALTGVQAVLDAAGFDPVTVGDVIT